MPRFTQQAVTWVRPSGVTGGRLARRPTRHVSHVVLHRCACVTPSACFVDVACCWHCSFARCRPALSAVVALFTRCGSALFIRSIAHRVVLNLDHASRRSGPLVSGSSSLTVMFTESASRRYSSSSVLLLLDVLVCLSVCLLVAPCATFSWHSTGCLVGELFACVQQAHSRAARGLLD